MLHARYRVQNCTLPRCVRGSTGLDPLYPGSRFNVRGRGQFNSQTRRAERRQALAHIFFFGSRAFDSSKNHWKRSRFDLNVGVSAVTGSFPRNVNSRSAGTIFRARLARVK